MNLNIWCHSHHGWAISTMLMEFEITGFVNEVLDDDNCGGM
jgi:hypothetical protein